MALQRSITIPSLGVIICAIFFLSSAFIKPYHVTGEWHEVINKLDTVPETDTVDGKIFAKVEIEASYPGGVDAWRYFLSINLKADVAAKNNAPAGAYTVIIQFVVNTDGYISDITALTNQGYGMETEVIRVLKKSPRWKPAIQDGRKVRAYRKQPVTFQVAEEKKKNRSKD